MGIGGRFENGFAAGTISSKQANFYTGQTGIGGWLVISERRHWQVISGSCQGAAHQLLGKPNQDAVAIHPLLAFGPALVLAVSDGHGSESCFRSDVGAQIAVDTASELGGKFLSAAKDAPPEQVKRLAQTVLIPEIVIEWRTQVYRHSGQCQPSERERSAATADEVLIPYGATLIAALLNESFCLLLQIGDGDAFTVSPSGTVHSPVPPDDRSVAGQTMSLCQPDAERSFRLAVLDQTDAPTLVVLSSDGYGNSFKDPNWKESVGKDLLNHVAQHGADWIHQRLESWIADSAEIGGDDVTVAIALRV